MSTRARLAALEAAHEAATPPPAVVVALGLPGESETECPQRLGIPDGDPAIFCAVRDHSTPRPDPERNNP